MNFGAFARSYSQHENPWMLMKTHGEILGARWLIFFKKFYVLLRFHTIWLSLNFVMIFTLNSFSIFSFSKIQLSLNMVFSEFRYENHFKRFFNFQFFFKIQFSLCMVFSEFSYENHFKQFFNFQLFFKIQFSLF